MQPLYCLPIENKVNAQNKVRLSKQVLGWVDCYGLVHLCVRFVHWKALGENIGAPFRIQTTNHLFGLVCFDMMVVGGGGGGGAHGYEAYPRPHRGAPHPTTVTPRAAHLTRPHPVLDSRLVLHPCGIEYPFLKRYLVGLLVQNYMPRHIPKKWRPRTHVFFSKTPI